MKYLKLLILGGLMSVTFFIPSAQTHAAALPFANVDALIKSISTKQVVVATTDENGFFSHTFTEQDGAYNVFIGDENVVPIKMIAKKGVVSGRVVVLTDGTTTKDPDPTPIPTKKVTTPVKKPVPLPKATKKATL